MSKEDLLYIFLAMVIIFVLIFLNADRFWNIMDKAFTPLVNYNADDNTAFAGAGSADANAICNFHVNWEKGNVSITYGTQDRITWKEVFRKGDPTQFNVMYYWMNSQTVFINYFSQDYSAKDIKLNRDIRKDLQIFIPQGCELNELWVRNVNGDIKCNVKVKNKDFHSSTEQN